VIILRLLLELKLELSWWNVPIFPFLLSEDNYVVTNDFYFNIIE
jgi:hypothetical protein